MKRHRFPTEMQDDVKIYCKRLREQGKKKLKEIAWAIKRDHTTVMYNLQMYEILMSNDRVFRFKNENFDIETFERQLKEFLKIKN